MGMLARALDGVYGRPASGLRVRLERIQDGDWLTIGTVESNVRGHIRHWEDAHLERGVYRLVIDSDGYFSSLGATAAYPEITVMFRLRSDHESCDVQIILSPYSYSTYLLTND
jgi:5-hydroxyisourate hydrolase